MNPRPQDAWVLTLDATKLDVEHPAAVAEQIPRASTRPPGSAVVVPGTAVRKREGLGRWLGKGSVKVSRAARCTALLARGYVALRASGDDVWAMAPLKDPPKQDGSEDAPKDEEDGGGPA